MHFSICRLFVILEAMENPQSRALLFCFAGIRRIRSDELKYFIDMKPETLNFP